MAIYWTHDEQGREPWSITVGKGPGVRGRPCDHRTAGPEQVLIADLIAFWLVWNARHIDRTREAPRRVLLRQAERLGSFWRCTATSLRYQSGRNANSVRSELARLRTIVDFGARCGLVHLGARALDYALPLRQPRRRQSGAAPTEIIRRFHSLAPDLTRKHFFTGHFLHWWPQEVDRVFARARLRLCGDGGR